ncbi:MAG: thiamine pyrophosphate-dependent dehydrogenase E1 component subunit alpha [Anaerolineae bacterium]|nr:thiamine pyrophosphate-dependent dehydrogenase E1 component subunit alpha [Anaerolineae bacterium]
MSTTTPDEIYQIINPEGQVVADVPDLPAEKMLYLYRWMVFGRVFSERMTALQRQGRMGTFAAATGQEAACVGRAAALQPGDWLLGSYRESLAYMVKGVPLLAQLKHWGGHIPEGYSVEAGCLPFQIVLGTQMLHAVGIAMAMKYKREPHVVLGVCGDGATSEGDFNEALNFAAVFKAPVVIVVENNGWAISVPRQKQSAATTLAQRGPGFGMPGYLVDGNDVLAVYQMISDCVARARTGQGPSLVELLTYRMGAHTTADDPTKYRPAAELQEWTERDPLLRFRKFLMDRRWLTDLADEELHEAVGAEFQAVLAEYESLPPPDPRRHFDLALSQPTPQLLRQQAEILEEIVNSE